MMTTHVLAVVVCEVVEVLVDVVVVLVAGGKYVVTLDTYAMTVMLLFHADARPSPYVYTPTTSNV